MKKIIVSIFLLLFLWSGTAFGTDVTGTEANNTVKAGVTQSNDLPEHSVDLPQIQSELFSLKSRVNQLEADVRLANDNTNRRDTLGLVLFLFGTVCAIWAQNTGRNPWVWFFAGMLFSVITALVMIKQNSDDRKPNSPEG